MSMPEEHIGSQEQDNVLVESKDQSIPEVPKIPTGPPPIPKPKGDPFHFDEYRAPVPLEDGLPKPIRIQSILTLVVSVLLTGVFMSAMPYIKAIGLFALIPILPAVSVLMKKEFGRIAGIIIYPVFSVVVMYALGVSLDGLIYLRSGYFILALVAMAFLVFGLFVFLFGAGLLIQSKHKKYFS